MKKPKKGKRPSTPKSGASLTSMKAFEQRLKDWDKKFKVRMKDYDTHLSDKKKAKAMRTKLARSYR